MKIFITGSLGFIGSHLVPILTQKHSVYEMKSDLLDFDAVSKEVLDQSPDIIVHLGARSEVEKSFYEQTTFNQINYIGSVNLIETAAKVKNLKNFVFASTMEVFGWQPISDLVKHSLPFTPEAFNEHTLPNPNSPYAVAKYGVEKYLEYMHRSHGFPFTAIRQTNTYGRPDNDFFITEQIITQMIKNNKEIFLGYNKPYRNFLFISDLLDVYIKIIDNVDIAAMGKIFTLGPDHPITIESYVDMVAKKLKWQGEIHWHSKPERPGEIYWLNSDCKLIYNLLNWQPTTDFDQGLDYTIKIWKEKLI